MKRFVRTLGVGAALAILGALHGAAAQSSTPSSSGLPSITTFFRNPDIIVAKLSPSGQWLAITTATKTSRVFLAIVDIGEGKAPPKAIASYGSVDIGTVSWVNDDRLVFNTIDLASAAGEQAFGPGLYSIRRDGSELRTLVAPTYSPIGELSSIMTRPLEYNHLLLGVPRTTGDEVIVGEAKFTNTGYVDSIVPKRLNVVTGRSTSVATGAPAHGLAWTFDARGRPRTVVTNFEGRSEVFVKRDDDAPWKSIARYGMERGALTPVALDGQGTLYVESNAGNGAAVLERFDFATGKPEPDALVSAPGFDIDATPIFDDTSRLVGVRFQTDAATTVWLDPAMKALQAMVDARFPGRTNVITCVRCTTDGVMLVDAYSDQDPGSYWLYRATSKTWESIGPRRNDIEPARMAQVDFYRTKARDGEDLPVWVTTPPGKADKPRPAVLLVHGGPWVRGGQWRWNAEAQFLASRGYVVVEPEFRGSLGYGDAHFRKGFKQWGLTMDDDLIDAVRWAADKGLIDPERVCIAGASYGGYATLMGLVRQPGAYKCGVAWVAVTDPRLLFANSWASDVSSESREYFLPRVLGDPVKDAALLTEAAPVTHAKEIRAPLLMAFGGSDKRVPIEHGKSMRDAMRDAGQKPEFIVYDGEGHGWLKVDNRVDFWTRVEKFLAQNLK